MSRSVGPRSSSCAASRIKRPRSTATEMGEFASQLISLLQAMNPMTVRQVFYQATVRNYVDKTEAGYDRVQRMLVKLRRSEVVPYGWVADNTRWQRRVRTYSGPAEALERTAELYRKALWADLDQRVEIWLEKDALAGVIMPVTSLYDVPLMVARGYASLSFLAGAAEEIRQHAKHGVRSFIYHFGDYDPSGVDAANKIGSTLLEMAPDAHIEFERVAVTPEQIRRLHLPSRPTKTTDSRAKGFAKESVELDAIPPHLRDYVEGLLAQHLPQDQLKILRAAEESERNSLLTIAKQFAVRAA
jgi:hypothetical protein